MYSLVYRSSAMPNLDLPSIRKMMLDAKSFNNSHGITGCLLYHNHRFVQLLEGDEEEVKELYSRILTDKRHREVALTSTGKAITRMFSTFSMVFNDLDDIEEQILHKRLLFDQIFHDSEAVSTPNRSKISLWCEVNQLLDMENSLDGTAL